jgi:hypothetical protein
MRLSIHVANSPAWLHGSPLLNRLPTYKAADRFEATLQILVFLVFPVLVTAVFDFFELCTRHSENSIELVNNPSLPQQILAFLICRRREYLRAQTLPSHECQPHFSFLHGVEVHGQ